MRQVQIINESRPLASALRADYCDTFLCKLRGLSFRRTLPQDWGLVMDNKKDNRVESAIHMLWMAFDLAVVWIDDSGSVVDVHYAKAWRSFIVPRHPARYVLEISSTRLADFSIGDQVRFEETN
ncbi:MAG: DUF192 domain-containing protein [Anaerolineae bacterium]|nr:DUF192 domain-containing protein [Anaerolineae bacterium]